MLKPFFIVFFFMISFLNAHGKGDGHMHFLGTLHIQDFFAVVAAIIVVFLVYKKFSRNR